MSVRRFVYDKDLKQTVEVTDPVQRVNGPYIQGDLPGYMSPAGTGFIEGRAARREDLKRAGNREVDPSERPDTYKSPQKLAAEKAYLRERAAQKPVLNKQEMQRLLRG